MTKREDQRECRAAGRVGADDPVEWEKEHDDILNCLKVGGVVRRAECRGKCCI